MSNYFIVYFLFIGIFLYLIKDKKKKKIKKFIYNKRKKRIGDNKMLEIAKKFIGKNVMVKTLTDDVTIGLLKEIIGNAIVIDRKNGEIVFNLEYVVSIEEFVSKKTKKHQEN